MGKAFVFLLLTIALAAPAAAAVPQTINYQGKVTDSSGQPLANGTYNMRFFMWSQSQNGSLLWQEPAVGNPARTVQVVGGIFNVLLGAVVAIPDTALQNGSVFLETEVNGVLISPRIEIVSVVYARRASIAETVIDNSVTSAKITDLSITTNDIGNGQITTGKISSSGATSGQALTYNGSSVAWGNPVAASVTAPVSLIQISSGDTLSVTNLGVGRAGYFNGKVGITGITSIGSASGSNLLITGGMSVDVSNLNAGTTANGLVFGFGSGEGIASRRTTGTNQYGLDFYTNFTNRLNITQGGDVGIGTNPTAKLDVNGVIRSGSGGFRFPDGSTQTTSATNFGLPYAATHTTTGTSFSIANNSGVAISGSRNVATSTNYGQLGHPQYGVYAVHSGTGALAGLAGENIGGYFEGTTTGVRGRSGVNGVGGHFGTGIGKALLAEGTVDLNGPGNLKVTIGTSDIYIRGDASNTYVRVHSNGDIEIKAGNNLALNASKDINLNAGGNINLDGNNYNAVLDSKISLKAAGNVEIKGSRIDLN